MQSESNIRALAAGLQHMVDEPPGPDEGPEDRYMFGAMLEAVRWCLGEPSESQVELLNTVALMGAFSRFEERAPKTPPNRA